MSFAKLNLTRSIQKALTDEGYNNPTPIQQKAIPVILQGKDLLGCAQTGTGKTAAFALPILQLLNNDRQGGFRHKKIRSLIITPTRELAIQINESFAAYGKYTSLKTAVVYGGVRQKAQTDKLKKGVDILIATPGRLLDLMNQNYILLNNIELFVLDEADRMLDMGFINDINKIISKLPSKRQSLFFSATMPQEIVKLARTILFKPVKIDITPKTPTVEAIEQGIYYVSKTNKKALLLHLLNDPSISSALVFTRTKHTANNVAKILNKKNIISEAIHGNKSQGARQTALSNFKEKRTRVLVATDIAARGIDIDELSHVINFEIPNIPETYVHRIGRTGRAGMGGVALSLCDSEERNYLKDIKKLVSKPITVIDDHPYSNVNAVEGDTRNTQNNTRSVKSGAKRFNSPKRNSNSRRKKTGKDKVWTNWDRN